MSPSNAPLTPDDARRRFIELLDEAGLPHFDQTRHHADIDQLELCWEHGFTIHLDLTRGEMEPLDHDECAGILGVAPWEAEEIHVTVPGSGEDPRIERSIPGVVIHRVPPLHPDDMTVLDGIPITSPSRTLVDCAECMTKDELRDTFARARDRGLLDEAALRASRARVEWRPSLAMLDEVIAEFCG